MQLVIYFGLGCVAAFLVKRTLRFGIFLLGIVSGATIGFLVYTAFLAGVSAGWLYLTVIIGFAVIGGLASWKRPDIVVRFGTAFIGSYMLVRGLSFWIGGFPSETELYQAYMNGQSVDYTAAFYGYLAAIAIVGVLSYIFQSKQTYDVD